MSQVVSGSSTTMMLSPSSAGAPSRLMTRYSAMPKFTGTCHSHTNWNANSLQR